MSKSKYIGTKEAAQLTGLSVNEILNLLHDGTIPSHQTRRGHYRFLPEGLEKLDIVKQKKNEIKNPEKKQLDKTQMRVLSEVMKGSNLFITGKAGTGKTFLLKYISEELKKQKKVVAVLASTGIAAKNAIGITIHSFLRLPTTPYFPGIKNSELFALRQKDEEMVKSVEMIIIDEVSMVRCDVLDAADEVLRHYRNSTKPFGGVQIVFMGDLYQLMPVAPSEDWEQLKKYYKSPYFFSSKAFEALDCPMLELKKVHRQKDSNFIRLLNHVRDGKSLPQEIKLLNTRYKANYKPSLNENNIILTTHNRKAKGINWGMLQRLNGDMREYSANKIGWFPDDEYPTDYTLQLKKGARVMFVRNDTSEAAEYVNGTLGVVREMDYSFILVETDEKKRIYVTPQRWEHERYIINKQTKQLETEVTGSFTQFPLKLAWAVTIHKSQGLTFDRVVIDAQKAFTYGQVYVALSRCRSLGGIILMTELTSKTIKADEVVKQFMASVKRIEIEDDSEISADNNHLEFIRPEDRTLFLVKNGMGIDDIVEQCGEKKGVVYSHLTKLAAEGKVNAKDFVRFNIFARLHTIFLLYDTDIDRHEVKDMCPSANYGEIELVRAYTNHFDQTNDSYVISYDSRDYDFSSDFFKIKNEILKSRSEQKKKRSQSVNHNSTKIRTSAIYESNINIAFTSKWIFNGTCRIVCSRIGGFYVNIYKNKKFVKIRGLDGVSPSGSIFVKRPDTHGWLTIVHAVSRENQYTIGYIKQAGGGLIFKLDLEQSSFMTINK
jgi:excisionase family DNA binding protein